METTFSLRPATIDDLSKMAKIEEKVHISPWTEEHFKTEIEKPYSQTLVVTDDETDTEVAGYVVTWIMFDECQILNVAVDLPFRGLGFAKQMLRKIITLSAQKGANKVVLEVRKSNVAAFQLYQSLQFSVIHIRKNFYSDGEDAYQMSLSLGEEVEDHF